ncbi:MAG: hypothetical protein ABI690_15890 [Chloroflexota bacterium]
MKSIPRKRSKHAWILRKLKRQTGLLKVQRYLYAAAGDDRHKAVRQAGEDSEWAGLFSWKPAWVLESAACDE